MADSKTVLAGGRWKGHLCVAGVVGRERNVRPRELAGRWDVPTAGENGPQVEPLGSTIGLSTRLLIVVHSLRRGSAEETERSSSGATVVSEATGEERKNVLIGTGVGMGE